MSQHSVSVNEAVGKAPFSCKEILFWAMICVAWSIFYCIIIFLLALFVITIFLHLGFPKTNIFDSDVGAIITTAAVIIGPILLGCLEARHQYRRKMSNDHG